MDRITAIKIKNNDGTYSDQIPISVYAENVAWDSTKTLVDYLNQFTPDAGLTTDNLVYQNTFTAIKLKKQDGTYSNEIPIGALAENITWDGSQSLVDYLSDLAENIGDGKYLSAENPTGTGSIAVGTTVSATGKDSQAFGQENTVSGKNSFAEGIKNTVSGNFSHAEGRENQITSYYSHAEGLGNIVKSDAQHVEGMYNIADENDDFIHIAGNGISDSERSNAYTLDVNGNAWFAGDVYVGSTSGKNKDGGSQKLITESSVQAIVKDLSEAPTAQVEQTSTGATVTITDKNGTTTANIENGTATDEQVAAWLDAHPEATTTVEDGSISEAKLADDVKENLTNKVDINQGTENAGKALVVGEDGKVVAGNAIKVDSSLTIEGAAADAKQAGLKIKNNEKITSEVSEKMNNFSEDIHSILEYNYSKNLWEVDITDVTEGKYLNGNTGREGSNTDYCYINQYQSIEPNTDYCLTWWRIDNPTSLVGGFNRMICYYDENYNFISGVVTIPVSEMGHILTPNNAAFLRFSMPLSYITSYVLMMELGTTYSSPYVSFGREVKIKDELWPPISNLNKGNYVIVDINGNGDYISINTAVNEIEDGTTIIVMPGIYEEQVKAWNKEVYIIGINRLNCILIDKSGNYTTPPLEIGAGSLQNMSIIEQANGAGTHNKGAYAIHIESNNLFNKKLLIKNCYIYSDSSSAIGLGLRGGSTVQFEDCEIICAGARASTGAAPLYYHDADGQSYWGIAHLYVKNCILRNTSSTLFSMLTINSIHAENTTYLHIMLNAFVRSATPSLSQKFNTWNTSGNTDADGWNGLSHMYLTDDSFGNNLTELNYST